jgi:hypothetical protein
MAIKAMFLLLMYITIFAADWRKLKQIGKKEWIVYGLAIAGIVYLSFDFILEQQWPNLNDLIDFLFEKPAKAVYAYFKHT